MLLFALAGAVAWAEAQPVDHVVPLPGGRRLIASAWLSEAPGRDWVVYVPGAGQGYHSAADWWARLGFMGNLAERANYLVLNKPGVSAEGVDRLVFERSFRQDLRLKDYALALRAVIPPGDSIYLVGNSEGAYLVPQIALRDERVKAQVLTAGGTRGWLYEELGKVPPEQREGVSAAIFNMLTNPTSTTKWNGFSYATWVSYTDFSTLNALKAATVPILTILGTTDDIIDLHAAVADLRALQAEGKDIKMALIEGTGHGFNNRWDEVNAEIREFLRVQVGLHNCHCKIVGCR